MARKTINVVALVMCLLLAAASARAQGIGLGLPRLGAGVGSGEPVSARAAIDTMPLVAGKEAEIAVEITINSRYHIQSAYAPKPYIAAKVTAKASPGLTFGQMKFPVPKDIPAPAGLDTPTLSVYEGKVYFLLPVSVAADAAVGERTLDLVMITQACDEKQCEPPKTTRLQVAVKIGAAGDAQSPQEGALFGAAHKQEYASKPPESGDAPATTAAAPTGVVPNASSGGRSVHLFSNEEQVALIAKRDYSPANSAEHEHSVAAIFLLALMGGFILNIMPCVLPVIPLKALSLVQQAHGDRRLALIHSLMFTAGVVSLFVLLAVLLRTFGLFYGQQFQSPIFLITITMFVVALALSMLGVWTINPPQAVYSLDARISEASHDASFSSPGINYQGPGQKPAGAAHPYLGSFGNGLMATILATPCSAPFLGGVLAWALVQPPWLTAAALATVGLGMSLPYLLLAVFPQLLNRVPRAGRWSELLKQGLGIVMLGVAVYLVTLVPNVQLWPWVLAGTIVVALTCWGWGQIPSPLMERGRIYAIRSVVVVVGLVLGFGVYKVGSIIAQSNSTMTARASLDVAVLPEKTVVGGGWLPFNLALLDEALKDGRPVVVDWTADWCPNCHALEALVLSREAVQKEFVERNALLLRADLSDDNPPATALNRKLGSEAIPVLAIFSPGRPTNPVVLRDSYTQARVIDEVGKAK